MWKQVFQEELKVKQQANTSASVRYPARVNLSQETRKATLRTPRQGPRFVSLNFKSLNLSKKNIKQRGELIAFPS